MNRLQIEGKMNSPQIDLDPATGLFKIIGRSIPENPVKFYQPVEDWIEDYLSTNPSNINLFIHLDYLNTHSTECVLILMKKIEAYYQSSGCQVLVNWNYDQDDEDMLSLGEDLASIALIPFEYKEIKE